MFNLSFIRLKTKNYFFLQIVGYSQFPDNLEQS